VKPTQAVQGQEQEEAYPRSRCNNAATGWNWYMALQHAEKYTEAATRESRKKQAYQELAKQQAP
jgi:hypothetical protein